ncbi:MAG: hypothetical protein JSV66_11375 [Trueperaceae bacterium]|nr:MAG: hypothetical protein JSV66_11375 [Trueperaceae bacterium]
MNLHVSHATLKVAHIRYQELQRVSNDNLLKRAGYPDYERQPRLARHWKNR